MTILKKIPTPTAGLALGIAGITAFWANIYPQFNTALLLVGLLLAGAFLLLVIAKFVRHPFHLWGELQHPVIGSVIPTAAMTTMLLSHTIGLWQPGIGTSLWVIAVILHAAFFLCFMFHQAKRFTLINMVPSWYVPPIGIVVACLSVPDPSFLPLAHLILAIGIISYIIMLPMIIYRLSLHDTIEEQKKPTLAVLAAPASLTLAGYLTLMSPGNPVLIMILFGVAVSMTVSVYFISFHLLRLTFSPGFSALTFPLVISATAIYKMSVWSQTNTLFSSYYDLFLRASIVEGVIATVVVVYVMVRYIGLLVSRQD